MEAADVGVGVLRKERVVNITRVVLWDMAMNSPKEDNPKDPQWEKLEVKKWPD